MRWALQGLLAQTKPPLLLCYVYVVFDVLLKETGHGARIIMAKYLEIAHCDRLKKTEVKCNKINQLGILNGQHIHLIEMTA